MDDSNYLNISSYWKTITDYFINNTIIINDNDDYKIYIEKFLLKYKRLIGLVLLTILLIIGYFEYNINNDNNSNKIYKVKEQIGGAGAAAGAIGAIGAAGVAPTKLGIAKGLASKGLGKGYAIGSGAAEGIRNNADWFYGMLYAIVISLAVFMIIIPSISFFVIGIICYFILKDKMKTLKGF